jgi:hypothetical protein
MLTFIIDVEVITGSIILVLSIILCYVLRLVVLPSHIALRSDVVLPSLILLLP